METLFIKNIINYNLFDKQPNILLDGLLNYYDTKKEIFFFTNNKDDNKDDYEIIINIDNSNLSENEEEDKNNFIKLINDEINRIKKIFEYLIINIDINKLTIPYYKIYNYNDIPKNLRSKIKVHNHIFDIKKFIIKNNINKDEISNTIALLLNKNNKDLILNDHKIMIFYILIKIFEFYNIYNKCLLYSLETLNEYPYIIRNKEEYLININSNLFTILNDKIEINHFNKIKNVFGKNNDKNILNTTTILISKNNNKNYELSFK